MVEEKLRALLNHVAGQHARSRGEALGCRWAWNAVHAVLHLGGKARLSLGLSQLADDLCSRSLGTLLLGDGIVGAGQLGGRAVAARVDAIALDLAAMAGVARPLDGLGHGDEGSWGEEIRHEVVLGEADRIAENGGAIWGTLRLIAAAEKTNRLGPRVFGDR